MKPKQAKLNKALLAGALVATSIAFLGGCFYPFLFLVRIGRGAPSSEYHDWSLGVSFQLGLVTSMVALPVILALTWGVGFPLFRGWIRRGYSGTGAFAGGGIIIALVGALVVFMVHAFTDMLLDRDFFFAILLLMAAGPIAGLVVRHVLRRGN